MRKVVQETNVFQFKELSEEVRNMLIEKERQCQQKLFIDDILNECMQEKAQELLQIFFGNNASYLNVYYELGCCQGDGAMIVFDLFHESYGTLQVYHNGSYYHERSFKINIIEVGKGLEVDEQNLIDLREKIVRMNKQLSDYGYKIIDNSNWSNEGIIEILEENEYLQDGTIFIQE